MGILITLPRVCVGTPLLLDVSKKGTISAPGPLSLPLTFFFIFFLLPIAWDCSLRPFLSILPKGPWWVGGGTSISLHHPLAVQGQSAPNMGPEPWW